MAPHDSNLDSDNERTRTVTGAPEWVINSLLETREHAPSSGKRVEVSTGRGESTPTPLQITLPTKYTFKGWLGRGGMGEVIHAYDNDLKRHVAIKFMRSKAAASVFARRRFLEEAHILAQMHHTNVVDVYEKGEIEGEPYFVMAHLDGHSLAERREEFRTSASRAVGVMIAVAAGVQHAHENGVCHRDLKASNVMFDAGRPVVVDFGCARWDEAEVSTQGFALLGTPSHMAPEVFELGSKEHDERADLWSLGVMLYLLLSGELPFGSDQRSPEGRSRLLNDDPAPIRSHSAAVSGVDDRLEEIVRKALAKNPAERHQTAAQFAAELQVWLDSPPPPAMEVAVALPAAKPKRRWRWLVAAGVAAVLLAVCATAAMASLSKPETVRSIGERIAADEVVTLIGAKGMPVYPAQRAAGFSEGTLEANADGFCEASAARVAMFDLADEPLPLPIRLTVEVSHTTENVGSKVGIYAGRKTHPQANGKDVCHAAAVNWFTASPFPPQNADKNGTASFALYWVAPADQTSHYVTPCTHPNPLAVLRQPLPGAGGEPQFRTLTIDLHPTTVAATHDGKAAVQPINLSLSLPVMREMVDMRGETRNTPVYPGNGFGVIVIQGSVVVRNVTLRRIPQ